MARVRAHKMASPPPLKKRSDRQMHASVYMPSDWSDNILDTLRKLALSTALQHAIVRVGYHAALLKISRLFVRLARTVTTEVQNRAGAHPPNLKAVLGPIINRRNKKSSLSVAASPEAAHRDSRASIVGLRYGSDTLRNLPSLPLSSRRGADQETMVMHLVSRRSSTPPPEGRARLPDARGLYPSSSRHRYQGLESLCDYRPGCPLAPTSGTTPTTARALRRSKICLQHHHCCL
ncbi:uncharacterized protein B0I36DRAFT_369899 [Microdochium trichocladiopsis]|uniref:Uncharacterized protein n=1 Tax=Microdochium trichocladiopsis TaxID=1682393 RepID=A0A9P9BIE3_9PEZI|nr:uncharacterized protein B0I36DRAFT_369899 [Microdochium trichocladiopsis]KAH7012062.1 hypothetical protein B0I36DRAFT_369899 [Microdochium trichocladiopsis]